MATAVLLGGDVYGSHLSVNGGKSFAPVRDGQNTADKLRIAGYCRDGSTAFAFAVGRDGGETNTTGTGVTKNYILQATIGADGSLSAWSVHVQLPGAWASGGNGFQAGDTYADTSGHPRQTGKMIDIKPGSSGYFLVGSWDGLWRVNRDGTGVTRIWGAGNSITAVRLDPADPTTAYVTIDIGPKKGVWRLTNVHAGTVGETGWTGPNVPYAQSLAAVKMGSGTHIVVATGKQVNSTASARTWSVAYLPPGASWTSGWRDITGVIGDDIASGSFFLSAGIDAWATPDGLNLAASHSGDKTGNGGGGTRIAWAFGWSGVGVPTWQRPTAGNTNYNLGNNAARPWWFRLKMPSFMADKPGFDSKSPVFVDANTIIFPGRSGVWRYDRTIDKLYPACEGMQATYAWGALCHPTDGLKGTFLDTDWNAIRWNNGPWAPPLMGTGSFEGSPSGKVAWGGSITPTGAVSISSGEGGAGETKVTGNLWATDPAYVDETGSGSNQPPNADNRGSLLWGSGATQSLVVGVQGSGVWRKVGTGGGGTWTKVLASATMGGTQTRLLTAASGDVGLVCDQGSGLYRTTDRGATWSTVRSGGAGGILSGHVAADPNVAGRFFHTASGKLYEIGPAGALSDVTPAAMNAPTAVTTWTKAGVTWVVVSDGPKIWLRKGTADWQDMTRQSLRHATGGLVRGLAMTAHGVLIVVCQSGYTCFLLNPDASL